jgi:cysteine desulfurase
MRAGTHNVPGIVGLGAAISVIKSPEMQAKIKEIKKLRDYLIKKVLKEITGSYLNGSAEKRSPNNVNFRFNNVEGEGLILSLDLEGIATSSGSQLKVIIKSFSDLFRLWFKINFNRA